LIGIYAEDSGNNTIWNNTFLDNGDSEAFCLNSDENDWDNGTIGNYWGDYEAQYPTANNDGSIWDIPYKINGTLSTYDNYPLVNFLGSNVGSDESGNGDTNGEEEGTDNGEEEDTSIPGYSLILLLTVFALGASILIQKLKRN
jgi:hypothetical protein